ncbi:MAG TPA: arylsulfatase [Puia sp.]|nr:arylsulfatase [Puia sp.]
MSYRVIHGLFFRCRTLLLLVSGLLLLPGLGGKLRAQQSRPNIIFILADDLGYGDVGCYGQQKIETPHIDALAAHGLRFTQFYAGTAVCAPSRASFMTGMHTGHTAVRGNRGFKPEGQYPLPDSTRTIARVLRENGYVTADFGKWGLGYPGSSGEPLKQGFEIFYGYNCQSLAHNYYPDHLWQDDQRVELPGNKTGDAVYSADLIHQHAMQFLQGAKSGPFFLWLSYTLPHAALSVPHDSVYDYYVRKFGEPARKKEATKPYETAAFEPYPHAAYAAMVARLDRFVGEVTAEVDRQGIAGNTLILFSSDNGPHEEGGNEPGYFDSNGALRGIKRDLYEGGIRVPFIAAWKGRIKGATTSDFAGAFWDLFPTFGEMAGATQARAIETGAVKPGTGIDGISILPTLLGKKGQVQHEYLYWEFHENDGRQAVRWKQWKGVRLNVSKQKDAPIELYDLSKDPSEKNNLAAGHPDIVKKIAGFMRQSHRPDKNWPLLVDEVKQN